MLAVGVAGFVLGVSRQRQQAAHNYRLVLSPLLHRPGRLGSPDPIPKLNLHAPERLDTYRWGGGSGRASHRAFRGPSRETGMRTSHGLPIREGAPSTAIDTPFLPTTDNLRSHSITIQTPSHPTGHSFFQSCIQSHLPSLSSTFQPRLPSYPSVISSEAAAVESSSIIDTKTCLSHQILPLRNECG